MSYFFSVMPIFGPPVLEPENHRHYIGRHLLGYLFRDLHFAIDELASRFGITESHGPPEKLLLDFIINIGCCIFAGRL